MSFQHLFRRFHETIQLKRFDQNADLREKRDRILTRLRDNLPWSFDWFNQGSYAIGTGIRPFDRDYDYDVDIGVVVNIDYRSYTPVTVKHHVHQAVSGHTTRVEWRRPCITVYYQEAGQVVYHVDLAILARDQYSQTLRLALGKEYSSTREQEWQPDDRQGFIQAVENRFTGEDAAQFRRVIRYLKRWKDVHFSNEGRAAPTGHSLTVAAYQLFQPAKNGWYHDAEYDDLTATRSLVNSIRQSFTQMWDSALGRYSPRLVLRFPFDPHDDVFARMSNQQMLEFYQRLEKLAGWLEDARVRGSTLPLQRAFGDQFPER